MRRGLIEWSKDELPTAVLAARVASLRAAMARDGVDALVAYTNFTRPGAVSWLCGFIPYWSECALIVPREGATTMVSAVSPRGKPWIASTTSADELVFSPRIGSETARLLAERLPAGATLGVVELDDVPAALGLALRDGPFVLRDAGELFAAARAGGDAAELTLARTAATIARDALNAIDPAEHRATVAVAAVDRYARRAGAEESYVAIAPDVSHAAAFFRLEGEATLGEVFAVRATVAYKGAWVRAVRTFARNEAAALAAGGEQFAHAVAALPSTAAFGTFDRWLVEAPRGAEPLATLAGSGLGTASDALATGALVSVQAWLTVGRVPLAFGAAARIEPAMSGARFVVAPSA